MNSCSDCETQGTCEDSQVLPKMYSCVAHAFREVEPSVNADGMITKKNYVCAHCFLTMSHQQTGGTEASFYTERWRRQLNEVKRESKS